MEWVISVNIAVILIVPCIVAARKLLLYRIPGRTWLLLWKILLLRLLCPFTFEMRLKCFDVSRNAGGAQCAGISGIVVGMLQWQDKTGLPGGGMVVSSFADEVMKIIWLAGAIGIACFLIGPHLTRRKLYRMALPAEGTYFEEWKKSHPLKRTIEIKKSDRIAAPLTYGFLRPVILLPARSGMQEQSLGVVLEHEFIHIRHMDVLVKWILVLICSFYWYNPLIWVMYVFVNRDIELACDESLLKRRSPGYKKEYLNILINLEEKKAERDVLCSSFCRYPIEERIRVMMKTEKGKRKNLVLAALVVGLIAMLNIGTAAKTGMIYAAEGKADAVSHSEGSGVVPELAGYDEENACKILWERGFAYFIR